MSDTFKNIEYNTSQGDATANEYATSTGVDIDDDINYNLPTDEFNIVGVYDDVILGDIYISRSNTNGEIVSKGGIVIAVNAEAVNEKNLYQVMEVTMVGNTVKHVKRGDFVVVSKTAGMKMVEFDGRKCAMVRETNIFMKVEPKLK